MVALAIMAAAPSASADVALYYGARPPASLFRHHELVVVDPDAALGAYKGSGSVCAYFAMAEVHPSRPYFGLLRPEWILGKNHGFGSAVLDLRRAELREYLLSGPLRRLREDGYRCLFLDVLDSMERFRQTDEERERDRATVRVFLSELRARYPEFAYIVNRGFFAVDTLRGALRGVVAESLFSRWNDSSRVYEDVPSEDRAWLVGQLRTVHARHRVPITVVDYVPRRHVAKRRAVARSIRALGFSPWVTTHDLSDLGTGEWEVQRRRALVVHDVPEAELGHSDAHLLFGAALERLGLVPDYVHTSESAGLDRDRLSDVAGMVLYRAPGSLADEDAARVLRRALELDVPIVLVGALPSPLTPLERSRLGLGRPKSEVPRTAYARVPFEVAPVVPVGQTDALFAPTSPDAVSWISYSTDRGSTLSGALETSWGGAIAHGALLSDTDRPRQRLMVPIDEFLRRTLRVEPAPIPDVATAGGRRVLTIHVDGDGFVSRSELPGNPFAGEALYARILSKLRHPVTVSLVEGEFDTLSSTSERARAMAAARAIFAMPHVEAASHTYSHPFRWRDAEQGRSGPPAVHLPIPGYRFDAGRELFGPLEFMRRDVLPAGKPLRLLQWTGDCQPSARVVAMAEGRGLLHVNGGGATLTRTNPSMRLLEPLGRPFPKGYQVYAPIENDAVYTNGWTGPYYGYRRVKETIDLTERPDHRKPMSVYFHFFAATKESGLLALDEVLAHVRAKEHQPLTLRQYVERVRGSLEVSTARSLDGAWVVHGLGGIDTLRLAGHGFAPEVGPALGVLGFRDVGSVRYVMTHGDSARLVPRSSGPDVRLVSTNGAVEEFRGGKGGMQLRVRAHVPVEVVLSTTRCRVTAGPPASVTQQGSEIRVASSSQTVTLEMACVEGR